MQTLWLEKQMKYDGTQLAPLHNYLQHGILGDSVVAWQGACDIPFEHMMDGEDVLAESIIAGKNMLHFVLEIFQFPLSSAVVLQRLMGEILITQIEKHGSEKGLLKRSGDDIYWGEKKLNISIATCSQTSSLIHFGVNITNEGTPVETCSLSDFSINQPEIFAKDFMGAVKDELLSIKRAQVKVRSF